MQSLAIKPKLQLTLQNGQLDSNIRSKKPHFNLKYKQNCVEFGDIFCLWTNPVFIKIEQVLGQPAVSDIITCIIFSLICADDIRNVAIKSHLFLIYMKLICCLMIYVMRLDDKALRHLGVLNDNYTGHLLGGDGLDSDELIWNVSCWFEIWYGYSNLMRSHSDNLSFTTDLINRPA